MTGSYLFNNESYHNGLMTDLGLVEVALYRISAYTFKIEVQKRAMDVCSLPLLVDLSVGKL